MEIILQDLQALVQVPGIKASKAVHLMEMVDALDLRLEAAGVPLLAISVLVVGVGMEVMALMGAANTGASADKCTVRQIYPPCI